MRATAVPLVEVAASLHGRTVEQERLLGLLGDARVGHSGAVVVVGVVVGLGERMGMWGTIGQIAGVAAIIALAVTWAAVATAGRVAGVAPMHVILVPAWVMGAFVQALARVTAAIVAALSATPDTTSARDADRVRTSATDTDDPAREEESADE